MVQELSTHLGSLHWLTEQNKLKQFNTHQLSLHIPCPLLKTFFTREPCSIFCIPVLLRDPVVGRGEILEVHTV